MINNNINFKSRQQVIRDAKWVAKTAHNKYPHVSNSMLRLRLKALNIECFDSELLNRCFFKINIARNNKFPFKPGSDFMNFYNNVARMKQMRVGNCSENARFAELIMKMNGVENVRRASLFLGDEDLDHVVTLLLNKPQERTRCVLKGKDAIVVDPWLGFADYVGNFLNIIKHTYNKIFEITPDESNFIKNKPPCDIIFDLYNPSNLSVDELFKLNKIYPGLIYNGSNGRKLFQNV